MNLMSKVHKVAAAIAAAFTYLMVASKSFAQDKSLKSVGVDPNQVKPEAVPQLLINGIFMIGAFLAVLYLMFGGVKWITSRGDKVAVESARRHIMASVIGLVIVVGSFFAINVVFNVLGACNPLSKGFQLPTLKTVSQEASKDC